MKKAATRIVHVPALVTALIWPPAPGPSAGCFRNVGESRLLYAWPGANGESVCYVSNERRRWLAELPGPLEISISDFDRLGSGAPLVVSGQLRTMCVGVEILIDGLAHQALVRNNVAFFEATDAKLQPADS